MDTRSGWSHHYNSTGNKRVRPEGEGSRDNASRSLIGVYRLAWTRAEFEEEVDL